MTILNAGPALSLQDMGRQGYLAFGVTRGGSADTLAVFEAAALLEQNAELTVIEMVGMGGTFQPDVDTVVALTGATMTAAIDGTSIAWNASHALPAGAKLSIGGAVQGVYGYLSVAGGFDAPEVMGARSSHLTAGIGGLLKAAEELEIATVSRGCVGMRIKPDPRLAGGDIHIVPSIQTEYFTQRTRDRFSQTEFRRDPRGNRQGVRMSSDGEGFFAEGGLSIVSEIITEGDIQITGDGAPYVLMCECQTTGGYPRIGTVIPSDMPRVAQAPVGAPLRFKFINLEEARSLELKARARIKALSGQAQPLVRNPNEMSDLLRYQLVSGAISAKADPYI